ncbi:hypothetical protein L195_g058255, partial [Trifolium pratense]
RRLEEEKMRPVFRWEFGATIRELEEEVKLLKNLKHPNIVVSLWILIMLV